MAPGEPDAELISCLVEGRAQGFLGPMPIQDQIDHALGMAQAVPAHPESAVDLGSGGGVPGLVLARLCWPLARWCLIESSKRRAAFLEESVAALDLEDRVRVVWTRAEAAGREPSFRHASALVTARSFGPPAVTAECGAPFLQHGGWLLVSEPPGESSPQRWPDAGLAELGLQVAARHASPVHAVVLRAVEECSDRYPRRVGVPNKRPLF